MLTFRWWTGRRILYIKKNLIVKYPQLVDNDNDNDNEIILLSWSYIFIHCTRATAYPTKTIFHLPRKHNVQCTGKKMVMILHDNEGMKPWLMGPNLCFTISRCQNRVQGNKVTVQYFGAMLNCHNAKQGLMFVSNIYRNNYEISINAYTYMHINIYMHIYMHI